MGKLGNFVIGCIIAGAAAGGVYHYLETIAQDQPGKDEAGKEEYSEARKFAERTYTTVKTGAEEVYGSFKDKIGPKGEEFLNVANETAGKVKEVFTDSAEKVKDIIEEVKEEAAEAVPEAEAPEAPEEVEEFFDDSAEEAP